jgi:hypothetical protein
MSLIKENAFNLNEDEIGKAKFILIRFYHMCYSFLIGLGFSFNWIKKFNWIWLYLGFRLAYAVLRIFPKIDEIFSKTLMDGLSCGILIIVILLIFRNEKNI